MSLNQRQIIPQAPQSRARVALRPSPDLDGGPTFQHERMRDLLLEVCEDTSYMTGVGDMLFVAQLTVFFLIVFILLFKNWLRFAPFPSHCGCAASTMTSMRVAPPLAPATPKIRILVYNIHTLPPGAGTRRRARRMTQLLLEIAEYDIVCLQEAFATGSKLVHSFIKHAKRRGFQYVATSRPPATFSMHLLDSGLLVLSRYPIMKQKLDPFGKSCGIDMIAEKSVQYVQVRLGRHQSIHIFHTHYQCGGEEGRYRDRQVQKSQIKQSKHFIQKCIALHKQPLDGPVLFVGDLNVDAISYPRHYHHVLSELGSVLTPNHPAKDLLVPHPSGYRQRPPTTFTRYDKKGNILATRAQPQEKGRWRTLSSDYILLLQAHPRWKIMDCQANLMRGLSDHWALSCCLVPN